MKCPWCNYLVSCTVALHIFSMEQVPSCGIKLHHGHFIPPTTAQNRHSNIKQRDILYLCGVWVCTSYNMHWSYALSGWTVYSLTLNLTLDPTVLKYQVSSPDWLSIFSRCDTLGSLGTGLLDIQSHSLIFRCGNNSSQWRLWDSRIPPIHSSWMPGVVTGWGSSSYCCMDNRREILWRWPRVSTVAPTQRKL